MYQLLVTDADIEYRRQQVHTEYITSQRQMSFVGIRQLLGNSVIALGSRIHGMAAESCQEAAETSDHIRTILRTSRTQPASPH